MDTPVSTLLDLRHKRTRTVRYAGLAATGRHLQLNCLTGLFPPHDLADGTDSD